MKFIPWAKYTLNKIPDRNLELASCPLSKSEKLRDPSEFLVCHMCQRLVTFHIDILTSKDSEYKYKLGHCGCRVWKYRICLLNDMPGVLAGDIEGVAKRHGTVQ